MVTLRKRVGTLESATAANEKKAMIENNYEQCRVKRMKENMERMQELGILHLSVKLKRNHTKPPNSSSSSSSPSPLLSSLPPRRSSRLQNGTPVNYSEKPVKKENTEADGNALVREGLHPEIYTEEQEKLLGSCEKGSCTLFIS